MSEPPRDGGFVVMDALVAVAILGIVGTGALMLVNGLLVGQDRQLDRSVALLMSELLAKQYARFGPASSLTRFQDDTFAYDVVAAGGKQPGSRMTPMVVVVSDTGGSRLEVLRLDFLAEVGQQ